MTTPCSLSSKDLSVLSEQMTHLVNAGRIAENYANLMAYPPLKSLATSIAQHQKMQFDALNNVLNTCH